MQKWSLMLLILTLFVLFNTTKAQTHNTVTDITYELIGNVERVPNNKTWTFTFNGQLDPATITPFSLFVLDSKGNKVQSLIINDNEQTVTVLPPPNRYLEGELYSIYFTPLLQSSTGNPLANSYQFNFLVSSSESMTTDEQDENPIFVTPSFINTSFNEDKTEQNEKFDLIKINEKQHQFDFHNNLNYEHPVNSSHSFYTRIKEMLIRIYTPPVYY